MPPYAAAVACRPAGDMVLRAMFVGGGTAGMVSGVPAVRCGCRGYAGQIIASTRGRQLGGMVPDFCLGSGPE